MPNSGTVRFIRAPGGRGTEVHVELRYDPPAGALGATIAKLCGEEPAQQVDGDLRRFKQVMETGEVVHSDASIHRGTAPGATARGGAEPAYRERLEGIRAPGRRLRMRATCWEGKRKIQVGDGARPEDPESARRDRADHLDRDLRLGPAPLQRLRPDDGAGRHPRPRVHGRGGGGRPRRSRTSRSATAWWCRSRSRAATAPCASGTCSRCARTPTRTRGWPRSCGPLAGRAIFGYSHMLGGFAGGQAEYARVPFADVGPLKVPDGLTDEQVLFLSDIFPTGYMGAEMCDIKPGDVIAVWGCRPGRPVRHRQRLAARRRAGDRHRPLPLPPAAWRARRPAPPT